MIKPQHRSITRGGWGEAAIKGGADYFVGVLRKNAEKRENSGRHGHVRHVGNELAVVRDGIRFFRFIATIVGSEIRKPRGEVFVSSQSSLLDLHRSSVS